MGRSDAHARARRGRGGPRAGDAARARRCSIRAAAAIDLAPIDATTDEGLTLLRAFLWPGREDRREPPRGRRRGAARASRATRADPRRLRRAAAGAARRATGRRGHGRLPDRLDRLPDARGARPDRAPRSPTPAADGRPLAWVSTRSPDERARRRARTPGSSSCASGRARCGTSRTSTSTATGSTGWADERHSACARRSP